MPCPFDPTLGIHTQKGKIVSKWWESPAADRINDLWHEGHTCYVVGISPDGRHALVVWPDENCVTVMKRHNRNGNGRWECSIAHFKQFQDLYNDRFPISLSGSYQEETT
jgi:hypothetical protein